MIRLHLSIALVAAALALPACSSETVAVPSLRMSDQHSSILRAHVPAKGDLYVADEGAVNIYAPGATSINNQITDAPAPGRLAFTEQGLLAVASEKGVRRSPTVFLYKAYTTKSYAKIILPPTFDRFTALRSIPKACSTSPCVKPTEAAWSTRTRSAISQSPRSSSAKPAVRSAA